jgi:ABC-type antimicrobial peptide transport system permease subunit
VSVPVILSAVALLAVWLPALRASKLNPMEALRTE